MPNLLSPIATLLLPHATSAVLLGALGGYQLATGDAPLLATALGVAAAGVLWRGASSLQQRLQAVIGQSAQALRDLGDGRNGFRLDAHGLAEFDPLLLAINDLREVVEPAAHAVSHRLDTGRAVHVEPATVSPRHA